MFVACSILILDSFFPLKYNFRSWKIVISVEIDTPGGNRSDGVNHDGLRIGLRMIVRGTKRAAHRLMYFVSNEIFYKCWVPYIQNPSRI